MLASAWLGTRGGLPALLGHGYIGADHIQLQLCLQQRAGQPLQPVLLVFVEVRVLAYDDRRPDNGRSEQLTEHIEDLANSALA